MSRAALIEMNGKSPDAPALVDDTIQRSASASSTQNAAQEKASNCELEPPVPAVPYTVFSPRQKRLLASILVLTMLASPLTATIYLPLLPLLATQFNATNQEINLSITIYVVFQAISPLLFATPSDHFGRRPIYLITYALYTAASIGLAVNTHSYAALLILRALQSLGASAVLAVAYGVVADVCTPAGRGSMLGLTQGAANLAVCLGPVIGGWVALSSGGFEWVFWALVIFGATVLSLVGVALPETARNVVGNGSIEPSGWCRTWWSLPRELWQKKHSEPPLDQGSLEKGDRDQMKGMQTLLEGKMSKKRKLQLANPIGALRIMFYKDTALVLWMAASPYAVWYCIQTSLPLIYKDIYGFDDFQIGLCYLPGGVGTVLGGYANGKLMDWNYKVTAKKIGHTIDKFSGDALDNFPIENARARGSRSLLAVYMGALAGFGWAVNSHCHESLPLILQFILAALCTAFQQTFNALLVDIFPASPSTAAASSNITRCILSAGAVAIIQPLVSRMGRGWFFTLLVIVSGGGGVTADWLLSIRGMQWRRSRLSEPTREAIKSNAADDDSKA